MLSSFYILASTLLSLSAALPLSQTLAEFPSNIKVGSSGMYTELGDGTSTTITTPKDAKSHMENVGLGNGIYTELGQGETLVPDQASNVPVGDGGMFTEFGEGASTVVIDP